MDAPSYSFGKEYKLCSKKIIDEIFERGGQAKHFPFIAKFLVSSEEQPSHIQFVISVPKRTFKRAVDRNRIKRLCRESVRINKSELEDRVKEKGTYLAVFLIYTAREELPLQKLNQSITNLFEKLKNEIDR